MEINQKKTCHVFSFTPLLRKTNRKTCPLSGRVVPCEGRGWKLRGDGVGMPYRFFPSPRVVEVKRAYIVEFITSFL